MATSPMRIEIKEIEGVEPLQLALTAGFDKRTLQRFTTTASINAARTLVTPMRQRAPQDTGKLAKAIAARRSRNRGGGAVVGIKGGRSGVWYRWPAVDAARPHVILARNGGFLSFLGQNVRAVNHPGKRANPFILEAAAAGMAKVQDAYAATIAKLMTDQEFRRRVKGLSAKYPRR